MRRLNASDARRRLLALVEKQDGADGCWLFKGRVRKNGYARVTYRQESHYLHRLAYQVFVGPIQEGMDVCHRCDVRRCARPAHLFTGTRLENMQDAKRKGRLSSGARHSARVPNGERNPKAKLTWEKVRAIRRRRNAGERTDDLAREFACDVSTIRLVVRGKTWKSAITAPLRT